MASEIGVQKLMHTNATQAATINSSGQLIIDDGLHASEGGAVNTSIGQGLAKAFLHYDASTNTVDDSFNISTVRDNSTGDFDIVVTNNYGNATPSLMLATGHQSFIGHEQKSETTSSETRISTDNNVGAARDRDQTMYVGHGDLA